MCRERNIIGGGVTVFEGYEVGKILSKSERRMARVCWIVVVGNWGEKEIGMERPARTVCRTLCTVLRDLHNYSEYSR